MTRIHSQSKEATVNVVHATQEGNKQNPLSASALLAGAPPTTAAEAPATRSGAREDMAAVEKRALS